MHMVRFNPLKQGGPSNLTSTIACFLGDDYDAIHVVSHVPSLRILVQGLTESKAFSIYHVLYQDVIHFLSFLLHVSQQEQCHHSVIRARHTFELKANNLHHCQQNVQCSIRDNAISLVQNIEKQSV